MRLDLLREAARARHGQSHAQGRAATTQGNEEDDPHRRAERAATCRGTSPPRRAFCAGETGNVAHANFKSWDSVTAIRPPWSCTAVRC